MILKIDDVEKIDFTNPYNLDLYKSNPFCKYFFYVVDGCAVAYIVYEDIYDRFEIDYIYVDDNYRRKGIATILLNNLFDSAVEKNVSNITLEVKQNNYAAINLYTKLGFKSKAVRKNYYKNIDGILMEKEMM